MAESSRYLRFLDERDATKPAMDCYVCLQMAQRKPLKQQTTPSKACLLCNNPFCEEHKGIGHEKYYGDPAHRAPHAPVELFPSLQAREQKLGVTGFSPLKVRTASYQSSANDVNAI